MSEDEWTKEVDRLRKKIKILELKNKTSLANNLCPDHRDKQEGKPCLACKIEALKNVCKDAARTMRVYGTHNMGFAIDRCEEASK